MLLRAHDGAPAREGEFAAGRGLVHQLGDGLPGFLRARAVDVAHLEHQGGIEHMALRVALFKRQPAPLGDVGVARAVDEDLGAHRAAAGLGFQEQRVHAAALVARQTGGQCVEQDLRAAVLHQAVGGALEGRDVVGLGVDLAQDQMGIVQAVHGAHAVKQVVGHAVHHLPDVAVDVGVQAAKIGHACRRAHAAQEAVAFRQQHAGAVARGAGSGQHAGGAAAQHHDVVLAVERDLARGFVDDHLILLACHASLAWLAGHWPLMPSFLIRGSQRLSSSSM
ncbi:hypothetical protein D3C72_1258830 [compost metagenome]